MGKQQQQQPSEPEKFERWTAQRKAAIILEDLKGQIAVPEAARKYGFTQGEYRKWADEFMRGGIEALKVNHKGLDAERRVEVRRLQAKIGQLVMSKDLLPRPHRPAHRGRGASGSTRSSRALIGL